METGSRDVTIPKGRGYVYAYENQLYNRVKSEGRTKHLKCDVSGCDGSATIVDGLLSVMGNIVWNCCNNISMVLHYDHVKVIDGLLV